MRRDGKRLCSLRDEEPACGRYGTLHCSGNRYVCLKASLPLYCYDSETMSSHCWHMVECECSQP